MDTSDKLYEFAEGLLPETEELELLAKLNSDSALRSELKNILNVNSNLAGSSALFSEPIGAKENIFNAIGLQTKIPETSAKSNSIFTAGISSVLTAILLVSGLWLGGAFDTDETIKIINDDQQHWNKEDYYINTNDLPEQITITKYIEVPVSKSEQIFSQKSNNNSVDINKFNKNNFENFSINYSSPFNSQVYPTVPFHRSFTLKENIEDPNNIVENKKWYNNFSIEWNASESWHFPQETISPSRLANFYNNQISLFYNWNQRFSVGINFRQETFFQRFSGDLREGVIRTYEQQPNFPTFSMMARYRLTQFNTSIGKINTFVNGSAGLNNVGPVGRVMLGLEFTPYKNLTFVLGAEHSRLWYWHQNNPFDSDKISFNYGLRINL